MQEGVRILEGMVAQQPAAIVQAATNGGQRHPFAILQPILAQRLNKRRRDAGVGKVAVIAEIVDELSRR